MEGDIKGFRKKVIVYQISIHALRVEGDGNAEDKRVAQLLISIHALRVEGDEFLFGHGRVVLISIHALRVEGDESSIPSCGRMSKFLSTPSGWRATASWTPYL